MLKIWLEGDVLGQLQGSKTCWRKQRLEESYLEKKNKKQTFKAKSSGPGYQEGELIIPETKEKVFRTTKKNFPFLEKQAGIFARSYFDFQERVQNTNPTLAYYINLGKRVR